MLLKTALRKHYKAVLGFNGHPPLGVNATIRERWGEIPDYVLFQWAPTLGGECYCSATHAGGASMTERVSMGTHPWG